MQAESHSDSLSGDSDLSVARLGKADDAGIDLTPQDKQILAYYLEEFQAADTVDRTILIDRIMGELYRLRPVDSPFDKKDAKLVCYSSSIVQSACSLILCYRKLISGSIITTIAPGVNTSSLLANGLLETPSINSIEMRCWNLQRSGLD